MLNGKDSSLEVFRSAFKKASTLCGDPSSARRTVCLISMVAVVVAILWVPRLRGPIDLRYDAGVYYELGASLASGDGFRIGTEPGAPVGVQYPPGLPAFVTLHIWILGTDNPDVVGQYLRYSFALIYLAYGIAVLVLARRYLPDPWALLATILALAQGYTLFISDLLFTEIPYTLLSVLLLLLLETPNWRKRPYLRDGLAFLLAGSGFLLRSAGVVLLIAWPLSNLLRGQWRRFALSVAMASIPFLGWQWHVKSVQQSDEYQNPTYSYQRAPYQFYNVPYSENLLLVDSFQPELGEIAIGTFLKRIITNAFELPKMFGVSVSTFEKDFLGDVEKLQQKLLGDIYISSKVLIVYFVILGLLAMCGIAILALRGSFIQLLIILGTSALVCTTPWPGQFGRYLIPLVPLLTIGFVTAIREIIRKISRSFNSPGNRVGVCTVITLFIIAPILMQLYLSLRLFNSNYEVQYGDNQKVSRLFKYDKGWHNWDLAVKWIAEQGNRNDIVATSSPHQVHLMTGIKAVMPPMVADPMKASKLMQEVPVRYVIVGESYHVDTDRRYALPAVKSHPEKWHLVYQIGWTRVFEKTGEAPKQ
jgi:hypothetical protein